ncbi:MAG: HlyD family efflux transporter periplasmic adaptor subunit [Bacteroidetes bacterium]|nr:MAG: HlyD family efflux transporter periplasmic adaptor subunit [Bacteroidota bacterium]
MQRHQILFILVAIAAFSACNGDNRNADAYGNFEAREIIVSSEANGRLIQFVAREGDWLPADTVLGIVDTAQLYLKKQQLRASIRAVLSRKQNVNSQTSVFEEQLSNLGREKARVEQLLKDGAATQKQLDDINGQMDVVEKQMMAQVTSLNIVNASIRNETEPLITQIEQVDDMIAKSIVRNPVEGRVLATYAEAGEIAVQGKPLFKVADTRDMTLRVYVSGAQLSSVKAGQIADVLVDNESGGVRSMQGEIIWISEKAEFTPKIIQTRDERVNLVYAMKVRVKNDGSLRIGMPGEVVFSKSK